MSDNIVFANAETIRQSPLGTELSLEQCEKLSRVVTAEGLEKGMFLLEDGQNDQQIHIISSGSLEVVKGTAGGEYVSLHILHVGDMVGELGFIDNVPHTAGVRALENTEVFSLQRTDLEGFLQSDPEIVYKVMRSIIRTVHVILRRMNQQYVEMSNYITQQNGRY